MRVATSLAYESYVEVGTWPGPPIPCAFDKYAIHVFFSEGAGVGDPAMFVLAETSPDGIRWTPVVGGGPSASGGYLIYNKLAVRGEASNFDAYITPETDTLSEYLRFSVVNATGSSTCRVRIYVTARAKAGALDGAAKPAGCGCDGQAPSPPQLATAKSATGTPLDMSHPWKIFHKFVTDGKHGFWVPYGGWGSVPRPPPEPEPCLDPNAWLAWAGYPQCDDTQPAWLALSCADKMKCYGLRAVGYAKYLHCHEGYSEASAFAVSKTWLNMVVNYLASFPECATPCAQTLASCLLAGNSFAAWEACVLAAQGCP